MFNFSKTRTDAVIDGVVTSAHVLDSIQTKVFEIYQMFSYISKYQSHFNRPSVNFDAGTMNKYTDSVFVDGETKGIEVLFCKNTGDIISARFI